MEHSDDLSSGRRALIDAVLLREVLCGTIPAVPGRANYAVTWPEYMALVTSAVGPQARDEVPDALKLLDNMSGGHIGLEGWVVAFFDLRRVHDLNNTHIEVVIPQDHVAPEVVAAMLAFSLDERSATNLVVAEFTPMVYYVTSVTLTQEMRQALRSRDVEHVILEKELELSGAP